MPDNQEDMIGETLVINLKKVIACEINYPENFTNVSEKPYGKLLVYYRQTSIDEVVEVFEANLTLALPESGRVTLSQRRNLPRVVINSPCKRRLGLPFQIREGQGLGRYSFQIIHFRFILILNRP